MKTLIVLSALPGSGKSTWGEQYRKTHKNVYVVSSDNLRKEIGGDYQNFEHEKEIWTLYYERINNYLASSDDVTVIADATQISNFFRLKVINDCPNYDHSMLVIIRKQIDDVKKRNHERNAGRIVPDYAIDNMAAHWEEPDDEVKQRFDEIIEVNGWFDTPDVKKSFHYKD